MADEDQVPSSEETESEETSETTQETETDQQESEEDKEQSKESKKEELYDLPDGRKVDLKTLQKEWKDNFSPEFTRRSQELAEYRRAEQERKSRAEGEAQKATEEDEIIQKMPAPAKAALEKLIQANVDKSLQRYDQVETQRQKDKEFEGKLDGLEKEYPGGDGKPKFERRMVVAAMRQPGNTNFDPLSKFKELHEEEFYDLRVKQALKKQKGGVKTERTGATDPNKPQRKTAKTFQDAGAALLSRLKQSE